MTPSPFQATSPPQGTPPAIRHLVELLDSRFQVPGTRWRFGIDPLLGLVPGLGDGVAMILQLYVILALLLRGSSGELLARMTVNVLLDSSLGSIPLIGQIWDFTYKSSTRNLRMYQAYREENKYQGNGLLIWLALGLLLFVVLAALLFLLGYAIAWLIEGLQLVFSG